MIAGEHKTIKSAYTTAKLGMDEGDFTETNKIYYYCYDIYVM